MRDRLNEVTMERTASSPTESYTTMMLEGTYRPQRKPKGSKRTPKPEDLYADAIKAGHVKVVRRRGKPPEIIWL